jgi:hypothetical protein
MSNLTTKQKQIISDITEQFKSINKSVKPSASFNFIDISAFNEEKRQGDIRIAELKAQSRAFLSAIANEIDTIVDALNEDFKGVRMIAKRETFKDGRSTFEVKAQDLNYNIDGNYRIGMEPRWKVMYHTINDETIKVYVGAVYEVEYRGSKHPYPTLAEAVRSDKFKSEFNTIYLKTL